MTKPVLYHVVCGATTAAYVGRFVRQELDMGWDVCVVATPSATKFFNATPIVVDTGHPVRTDYKQPNEPDVLPDADCVFVAPATFNTINKVAVGITDTLAAGVVCEYIGRGKPVLAVPSTNPDLQKHPIYGLNLKLLESYGVQLFDSAPPAMSVLATLLKT